MVSLILLPNANDIYVLRKTFVNLNDAQWIYGEGQLRLLIKKKDMGPIVQKAKDLGIFKEIENVFNYNDEFL